MKKFISIISVIFLISVSLITTSCLSTLAELDGILSGSSSGRKAAYTNDEAVAAMKDALVEGILSASSNLSKTDAYYKNAMIKILLPKEAQPILNVLNQIPGGQYLVDDVVLRLNRTAETAAKDTVSIFSTAIKSMTVIDGIKIVTGKRDAATQYLKEKCYTQLVNLYRPKISTVLNKPLVLDVSANTAWSNLVTNYNKIGAIPNSVARLAGQAEPFPAVEVDLAKFATEKALDGLFYKIGEEEGKIRDNPLAYTSEMIRKVFGYVKRGITTIAG